MVYVICFIACVICFVVGLFCGLILEAKNSLKLDIGVLNVVEWPDGTSELLLQLDAGPEKLDDGDEISLRIHKTRK